MSEILEKIPIESLLKAPGILDTVRGEERCVICGERMHSVLTQNRIKKIWYYVHTNCAYHTWIEKSWSERAALWERAV